MSFWVADPDQLAATADQLKVQADRNDQSIVDFELGLNGVWAQWTGAAADAAKAENQRWLQQAQMSQDKLRAIAACLQSLSDIYAQCHTNVQGLWRS